jgi:5-methylcytosine-specific restriction endonuclease McrA
MNQGYNETKPISGQDNTETGIILEAKEITLSPENRRNISLGLRYKVLKRDNFRCVRCGRSPSTTVGLELEIDHKLPYSAGGRTVLENLETKCSDCNIGKGNRFSE